MRRVDTSSFFMASPPDPTEADSAPLYSPFFSTLLDFSLPVAWAPRWMKTDGGPFPLMVRCSYCERGGPTRVLRSSCEGLGTRGAFGRVRYARAGGAGRPGMSRSGGGGAGFGMPCMSWLGTSAASSPSVHLPLS